MATAAGTPNSTKLTEVIYALPPGVDFNSCLLLMQKLIVAANECLQQQQDVNLIDRFIKNITFVRIYKYYCSYR